MKNVLFLLAFILVYTFNSCNSDEIKETELEQFENILLIDIYGDPINICKYKNENWFDNKWINYQNTIFKIESSDDSIQYTPVNDTLGFNPDCESCIVLYPNPFKEYFNLYINYDADTILYKLRIVDSEQNILYSNTIISGNILKHRISSDEVNLVTNTAYKLFIAVFVDKKLLNWTGIYVIRTEEDEYVTESFCEKIY